MNVQDNKLFNQLKTTSKMRTSIVILFVFLFMVTGNILGQNWNKIAKEIRKEQLSLLPLEKRDINCYYDLRRKSDILRKMNASFMEDTIFILQTHRIVAVSCLILTVWNKKDTLSVSSDNSGDTFQITGNTEYTKYMMKLVSEWNMEEVKNEEIKNGVISPDLILVTRIIFNEKKYKIDCLYFSDFFDIKRDLDG